MVRTNNIQEKTNRLGFFSLKKEYPQVFLLILATAIMSLFSNITYESILSPMILSRSHNNQTVLTIVNAFLGIGSIVGSLIAAGQWFCIKNKPLCFYFFSGISFLFGDSLMALGTNAFIWSLGAMATSLPLPIASVASKLLVFHEMPDKLQAHVFSLLNGCESVTIPIGAFLGGFLADDIFMPLMKHQHLLIPLLNTLAGNSKGNGMALMFLCTSVMGSLWCIVSYLVSDHVQTIKKHNLHL